MIHVVIAFLGIGHGFEQTGWPLLVASTCMSSSVREKRESRERRQRRERRERTESSERTERRERRERRE